MLKVLEPTYFPPISHWKHISSNNLQWSINSSYNKQTLTNRTYIDSSNGELMLTVPIKHSGKNVPRKFSEIKIDNSSNWKKTHYKSIKICYQSSPFFEFYEDDISFFYESDYEYLHQLNFASINLVCNWINLEMPKENFNVKEKEFINLIYLSNTKRTRELLEKKYTQTFQVSNGFINDLSILDLIFNCGPDSKNYF
tara:strand:+ start:1019 stop:1609 length:591 start_codon:yes stop_codon:yes gene_type:complete